MHDASESYISDLTRPVKQNFRKYFEIEEKLQGLIYQKVGLGDLSDDEIIKIKNIDDSMLYYEFQALMGEKIFEKEPYIAMKHDFSPKDFNSVENEFIYTYKYLTRNNKVFSSVGIDGCKKGWVAVRITEDDFEIEVFDNIETLCSRYKDSNLIIDMPIGLPENIGDIRPEREARKILGSRSCCVFNTPCRQAVYEDDYDRANEINKEILGKGLSKQSFSIFTKIREIDEFLYKNPNYKNKIVESHPEVCFAMLNFNEKNPLPIIENKKTKEGMNKRLDLLSEYDDKTEEIKSIIFSNQILKNMKDDIVDALCLAVVGKLGIENGFITIPENPMKDSKNIIMQMVYADLDF